MKNGKDDQEHVSNVVSLAGARKQAKAAARARKSRPDGEPRPTVGQWLISAMFMVLAVGGMLALAAPLLRAAGIVGE